MKPASNRRLYNGDCNYLFASDYSTGTNGRYTAKVFHDHVDLLASSGIDTFVVNVNGQQPWYPSKALGSVLDGYTRGDRMFARPLYPPLDETFSQEQLDRHLDNQVRMLDRLLDLQEAGVDWVAECAKACRQRGISAWASFRTNDMHGANSWEECYFNCDVQRNPTTRLKGLSIDHEAPLGKETEGSDYAYSETRDYYLEMIREIVQEYDYDGIELDWNRMPLCFNPPASEEQIELLLDWTAQIRALTQKQAKKNGRPYYVAVRCPGRIEHLRTVGIDIVAMAQRDLIDVVIPANQWQMIWDFPVERYRKQFGDNVAIYGSLDNAPNWLYCRDKAQTTHGYRLISADPAMMRGAAASLMANGSEGFETYNFFAPDTRGNHMGADADKQKSQYSAIAGLDDLSFLQGKEKHYALQTSYGHWMQRFFEYAEQLPSTIEHGGWRTYRIPMCAEKPEDNMQVTIQLVLQNMEKLPRLGVSLNGSWPNFRATKTHTLVKQLGAYLHHMPENIAFNYTMNASDLKDGSNDIVVYHESEDNLPNFTDDRPIARLLSLEVLVSPGK